MSELKFYTDEHIDPQIVTQLSKRGIDVVRCQDVGMIHASDEAHLIYATEHERIVLTCDQDFPRLHDAWHLAGKQHGGIAFMTQDLCNNIGLAVRVLSFWHEAVAIGAANLNLDFVNQLNYVRE